ncbi:hypothetical protein [Megalodesulfovibrio paquesii]
MATDMDAPQDQLPETPRDDDFVIEPADDGAADDDKTDGGGIAKGLSKDETRTLWQNMNALFADMNTPDAAEH